MENKNIDILGELENNNSLQNTALESEKLESVIEPVNIKTDILSDSFNPQNISIFTDSSNKSEQYNSIEETEETKKIINTKKSFFSGIIALSKYLLTTSFIFALLLVTANYSAYINIAKSYIFKSEMEITKQKLISSVNATNIKEKYSEVAEKEIKQEQEEVDKLSIKKMKKNQDKENINLDIEMTPYENRIIIPKISQNIPLIDIKNRSISGQEELNEIFMEELEKGTIRYPGSAKPGENGVSFIFGHSSNFPWIKGDYNEAFALLDNVKYGDEIIVYYGQEKYVYRVTEKKIITPGDVSVLKRNNNKSEITLMTCWPIGTTLNRLIVTGELIKM